MSILIFLLYAFSLNFLFIIPNSIDQLKYDICLQLLGFLETKMILLRNYFLLKRAMIMAGSRNQSEADLNEVKQKVAPLGLQNLHRIM